MESNRRSPGFDNDSALDVSIIPKTGLGEGVVDFVAPQSVVRSIGPQAIANKMRGQAEEFPLAGLPKTFEVFNRAQLGNVRYWTGGFDSIQYPEDATEERSTWLAPGEKASLPLEAVLHFFGNIFHPSFEGAKGVIDSCGGFLVEPKGDKSNPNDQPRIIGGPLFLPDFMITGYSGRAKVAFGPFALYEVYDKLTRRLQVRSILQDQGLKAQEAALLESRLEEYRDANASIYDQYGVPIDRAPDVELCDCSPIEHVKGVKGCVATEHTGRVRRGRKPTDEVEIEALASA